MSYKIITALATPYKRNGEIDVVSLAKLLKRQVDGKVDGVLACGTTGEEPFLTFAEKQTVVSVCKIVAGELPVWVGIGGSTTAEAVKKAKLAKQLGADELLLAPPPFSKCTETGYAKHVTAVCHAFGGKVWLYDCPSRSGYGLPKGAIKSAIDCVAGIKTAASDDDLENFCKTQGIETLRGCDEKAVTENVGGVISVTSNVAPILTRKVGEKRATEAETAAFLQLVNACFAEVNPVPIKYLLQKAGVIYNCELRLPLTAANPSTRLAADEWLARYMPDGAETW